MFRRILYHPQGKPMSLAQNCLLIVMLWHWLRNIKYFLHNFNSVCVYLVGAVKIYLFLNNQPDALIIPILFCYKTLHVSRILSAETCMKLTSAECTVENT
jgi:hypothetical protein